MHAITSITTLPTASFPPPPVILIEILPFVANPIVFHNQTTRSLGDVSFVVTHQDPTPLGSAPQLLLPTDRRATSSNMARPTLDNASLGRLIATRGTVFPAATRANRVRKASIGAPYADPKRTTPNNAMPSHNLLIINTPFVPDQWELALYNTPSFNKFLNVPISLRLGFDMGVSSTPFHTYTPPNHNSALLFP